MTDKAFHYENLSDVPESAFEKLSNMKIFFGHQSVGFNIMDGVNDLMKEYPKIKFNIIETNEFGNISEGAFTHSRVGKNRDPKSKIDDFTKFIERAEKGKIDVAALKFCYVDVTGNMDVNNLFEDYKTAVLNLHKSFPDLTLIHFTIPLTVSKTTWKTWVKQKLGKQAWEYEDNMKRNQYNDLLIKEYQDKEPILDIAKIESTRPDGFRQSFDQEGVTYYSMVPEYTYDNGHLNEIGRRKVAEQLILLLLESK